MALICVLLFPSTAGTRQSTLQFTQKVLNALDTMCTVVDLAAVVRGKFSQFGEAISGVRSGIGSQGIGARGETSIRELLDKAGLEYTEQVPFSEVASRRGRRGDFQVYSELMTVYVESKNKARITLGDVTQIGDYKGTHTIVAVRSGAKVSRSVAERLSKLMTGGAMTIVQCAFAFP